MDVLPRELAAVERVVRLHPRASDLRVSPQDDRIVVYERAGLDVADMLSTFGLRLTPEAGGRPKSGFAPVLRFILDDPEQRTFRAERAQSYGSDAWVALGSGALDALARRIVPQLGGERFFEDL
jgi:hypothetical protein